MAIKVAPPKLATANVDASDVAGQAGQALRRQNQAQNAAGGQVGGIRLVSAATYISSTDTIIHGDTTSAGFTLTLPLVAEYPRMLVYVVRSAGANNLVVASRGSDTIDGGASVTVTKMRLIYATPGAAGSWTTRVMEN